MEQVSLGCELPLPCSPFLIFGECQGNLSGLKVLLGSPVVGHFSQDSDVIEFGNGGIDEELLVECSVEHGKHYVVYFRVLGRGNRVRAWTGVEYFTVDPLARVHASLYCRDALIKDVTNVAGLGLPTKLISICDRVVIAIVWVILFPLT